MEGVVSLFEINLSHVNPRYGVFLLCRNCLIYESAYHVAINAGEEFVLTCVAVDGGSRRQPFVALVVGQSH